LIDRLLEAGAKVHTYDPVAMDNAKAVFGDRVSFFPDSYSAVEGTDALVIMTEWNEFRVLDLEKIKELLKQPILIDCRNIYKPKDALKLGFRYRSFGRRWSRLHRLELRPLSLFEEKESPYNRA